MFREITSIILSRHIRDLYVALLLYFPVLSFSVRRIFSYNFFYYFLCRCTSIKRNLIANFSFFNVLFAFKSLLLRLYTYWIIPIILSSTYVFDMVNTHIYFIFFSGDEIIIIITITLIKQEKIYFNVLCILPYYFAQLYFIDFKDKTSH